MSAYRIKFALLAGCVVYLGLLLAVSHNPHEQALIFSAWGTVEETQNLVHLVASYNALKPHQKVKFVHIDHQEYDRKILIQTAAGNPPDVFLLSSTDLSTLAYRGVLEELDPWIAADSTAAAGGFDLADFFPALLRTATIRGRIYGIPIGYTPMVVYYNRRLFREAGVPYPDTSWTWDDFLQIALRLTQKDASGRIKQYGCMISMAGYTFVYQFGGNFFDENLEWCRLDQPKTIAALQFYGDLAMKYHVTTSPTDKLYTSDQGFRQEAVAMIAAGRWQVPNFARTRIDWGVAPMPHGEASAAGVIVYNVVMSKFSKRQQQAWEFMKFMASPLAQQQSAKSGNVIPSIITVANSKEFLEDTTFRIDNRIFLHGIEHARPWPMEIAPETSYLNQWMILNEEMEKAMLGRQSYAEAAISAQARINTILRSERQQAQGKPFWGSRTSYLLGMMIMVSLAGLIVKCRRRSHHGNFEKIDWENWTPQQRATLLFVVRDGHILLIHKKRGLGAGKINGPGGRLDPGELAHECAIREVQEELHVTPIDVKQHGVLRFQFVDGLSIHCEVFTASDCDGEPQETDEATPIWTPLNQIPYDQMWADDRIWLPQMLAGKRFEGRFLFDGDTLLAHELIITGSTT